VLPSRRGEKIALKRSRKLDAEVQRCVRGANINSCTFLVLTKVSQCISRRKVQSVDVRTGRVAPRWVIAQQNLQHYPR
jgi:hypothetical protein